LLRPEDVSGGYYDTIAKFCGGSIVPLMSHLVSKRPFDKDEIALLEQIVASHRNDSQRNDALRNDRTGKGERHDV
jgi:predicted transcriptional regulator